MIELARNNFSAPVNQKKKKRSTSRISSPLQLRCKAHVIGMAQEIPDILDRFRRYPIGLSADVEKAFLQLGITPKHRDFLRFFYPDEGEEIVYRHCRVVFGVSSSPFLLAAVLAHLLENVPANDAQLDSKIKLSFYADNCVTGVNDIAQEEFVFRSNTSQGVKVALVRAKARVAPLKQVTIPILELMACYIGARWAHSVQESLNITEMETVFWSDSMVALYWLREKGDELEGAEIQLNRSVQAQSFTDEKLISNLSVFRDDNIIRVKTRITERIDAPNFLSPILLPNNCVVTQRLLEHFNLKNHHAGTQLLLSIIREKHWIIGGRRTVRKIWNACVKCQRFKSKSPMTDPVSLPSDRVKDAAVLGAYNELVDIDWNEVSRYAEIQRITWKFIHPTAAWWGGVLERLDLTPITLARFLFEIPTADTKDLDVRDANHFRKRLRFRAKVIEELKRRFRNLYLGQLIQRQKQHPQSSSIEVGDIVLIGDDWKKRLQWPLTRVIKLIPGKDGLMRTVKLKTQSCTLIQPIQRVFPLEVSVNDITSLPLQKVPQADSSVSYPNPDTLKATEKPQVTRCGRSVKKPDKLSLLTLTDVFD
ncbi:integrase catalytic domain-containing protein [Trichonephila clavipes]|nr:integrase catalytic domain-containing protein [Trichonephila clavipes]